MALEATIKIQGICLNKGSVTVSHQVQTNKEMKISKIISLKRE